MKRIIRVLIAAALCVSALTAAGCSGDLSVPQSPAETGAAVSGSAVTDADVADVQDLMENLSDTFGPGVTGEVEEVYSFTHADCTAKDHNMVSAGKVRKCVCGAKEVELPAEMWTGHITTGPETIEAGGVEINFEKGVYVPGNIKANTEKLITALETVSGLSFSDARYNYNRVNIHVGPVDLYGYGDAQTESEVSQAWAVSGDCREVELSPGDMTLGNSSAMAHELSHTLHFSQTDKMFCQVVGEGFASYNCYKVQLWLEENYPEAGYAQGPSESNIHDMTISDPEIVYTQDIEYWMENDFPYEYAGNGSYALGFRFMAYLDEVYGDYAKWMHVSADMEGDDQNFPFDKQIECLKATYGNDVLDNFYPWLKQNEGRFEAEYYDNTKYDLTKADSVAIYPFFMSFDCPTNLLDGMYDIYYSDLYVDLEECRKYLSEYKGREVDDLVLNLSWTRGNGEIELFDKFGASLGVHSGEEEIPIKDVSFVLLKGDGVLTRFEITGYKGYSGQ